MKYINDKAIFSDGTPDYLNPPQPQVGEKVHIRCRTQHHNVCQVYLLWNANKLEMDLEEETTAFDYYGCDVQLHDTLFSYVFLFKCEDEVCYLDRMGTAGNMRLKYAFEVMPGFATPDWAQGAVMYQIFVDRFYNGEPENNVKNDEYFYLDKHANHIDVWNQFPSRHGVSEFFGGDLQGVIDKLDYLQDLGVEVIYLNPIFVSPSNHKYDIQDYNHVDPHFGVFVEDDGCLLETGDNNNEHSSKYACRTANEKNLEASDLVFIDLVKQAHERGIKVILDGVFNHCGSFNRWMDREGVYKQQGFNDGAYKNPDSPYRSFFSFKGEKDGEELYEGWWGYDTLPKLNYDHSPQLVEEVLNVAKRWVSPPFNADGWRLDVAADLGHTKEMNHIFWRKFREAVKSANPVAIILAEHYGNASDWLDGDQWDTIMNYDGFMDPVGYFLTGMEKHSDEFKVGLFGNVDYFMASMKRAALQFFTPSWYCAMNELSNHDHSRFLTRTNHIVGRVENLGHHAAMEGVKPSIMRAGVVMQMTLPGAPTVYYGDEAGVCGFTDPDNRRTYPWGSEDQDLLNFHKDIIKIHKNYPALRTGSFQFLTSEDKVISYTRFTRQQQIIVVVNVDEFMRQLLIDVSPSGLDCDDHLLQILFSNEDGYSTSGICYSLRGGYLDISLPPKSAIILCNEREQK